MFKCECVCRKGKYKYGQGASYTCQYKKLMVIVGKALKQGKQVVMTHEIVDDGDWYDKVIVTIK